MRWWTIFCHKEEDVERCQCWRLANDTVTDEMADTLKQISEYFGREIWCLTRVRSEGKRPSRTEPATTADTKGAPKSCAFCLVSDAATLMMRDCDLIRTKNGYVFLYIWNNRRKNILLWKQWLKVIFKIIQIVFKLIPTNVLGKKTTIFQSFHFVEPCR